MFVWLPLVKLVFIKLEPFDLKDLYLVSIIGPSLLVIVGVIVKSL